MNQLEHTKQAMLLRRSRVRSQLHGTKDRPRLSVNISHAHITAQLIDDDSSTTLIYVSSVGRKLNGTMTAKATTIGSELGKKAKAAKVKAVIFDRGSRLYHGRVKALAEAVRSEGLEF